MFHKIIFFILIIIFSRPLKAQVHNPHQLPFEWKTDTSKHIIKLSDLTYATKKDAIPTLDFPAFITQKDKAFNFYELEPVIAITLGGETKAYPLSLLTMYELANDSIGGMQVMVTFCPACNAALVFNRKIKNAGKEMLLDFGVSGLLMHNDMVMYDRQTESWWEQLMGQSIAGELSNTQLEMLPALIISMKDYLDRFPEGKILSPEGLPSFIQANGHNVFHHLEHGKKMNKHFYIPEKVDPRLPPLERVVDIHVYGHNRIYPFSTISEKKVINDIAGDSRVVVFYHGETVSVLDEDNLSKSKKTGSATAFNSTLDGTNYTFSASGNYFTDEQTGSTWDITGYCREGKLKGKQLWILPHSNHFAFAYLAFFPKTEIYGK